MTLGSPCQAALGPPKLRHARASLAMGLEGVEAGLCRRAWEMVERVESPKRKKCDEQKEEA